MENILEVKDLKTTFNTKDGVKEILKGISFNVKKGSVTCVVGQSGSGKSMTAMSIIKVLPKNVFVKSGDIIFDSINLTTSKDEILKAIRGKHIFSIFQNPINCFNYSLTMEQQLYDLISSNIKISKEGFKDKIIPIMESLNLENPKDILSQYPFQLSGGMLQRMMIAAAIFMEPEIIIADEPTTALDVTTQKEILKQLKLIQERFGTTIIMITHDFGVVAEIADEVIVMKEGEIVEIGNAFEIFNNPTHDYTVKLIKATFDKEVLEVC